MARYGTPRATRDQESSDLLVRGLDVEGREFQESTETIDISESGISFLLNTSIWMDSHLTIEIRHSQVFGPCSVQKAKVVRLRSQPDGKQLVGARFD